MDAEEWNSLFSLYAFLLSFCCAVEKEEWKKKQLFLYKEYIYLPEVNQINPVSTLSLPISPWNCDCVRQIYGVLSVKMYFSRYAERLIKNIL